MLIHPYLSLPTPNSQLIEIENVLISLKFSQKAKREDENEGKTNSQVFERNLISTKNLSSKSISMIMTLGNPLFNFRLKVDSVRLPHPHPSINYTNNNLFSLR